MSLLPSYMDEIWRCFEDACHESFGFIDVALVSTDPQKCSSRVLPFLAWECDVDISGVDETTARSVIRAAFDAMQYAGTIKALRGPVEALSDNAKVTEWFHYDGEPYHFKVDIAALNMNRRFSAELFANLKKYIDIYKNVRSVLDEYSVKLQNATGKVEVAGAGTLSAKLSNELNLDYQSFGSIEFAGANVINTKLSNDFIQDDKTIAINTTGGGVIDVKLSNEVGINYPVADIKIQGAGIWTI